jgi:hypothetical protein
VYTTTTRRQREERGEGGSTGEGGVGERRKRREERRKTNEREQREQRRKERRQQTNINRLGSRESSMDSRVRTERRSAVTIIQQIITTIRIKESGRPCTFCYGTGEGMPPFTTVCPICDGDGKEYERRFPNLSVSLLFSTMKTKGGEQFR